MLFRSCVRRPAPGHISGFGTHEELLKTNAIYQEVYESQTNGSGDFDKNGGED